MISQTKQFVFTDPRVLELLCAELPPLRRKVEEPLLLEIAFSWPLKKRRELDRAPDHEKPILLVRQFQYTLEDRMKTVEDLQRAQEDFQYKWDRTDDPNSRNVLLEDASRYLGGNPNSIRGDQKALQRWFSEGAVLDRFRKKIQAKLREIVILLEQSGKATATAVKEDPALWNQLDFEETLEPFWGYLAEPRLKVAAFGALARAVKGLPPGQREQNLNESTLRFVYRNALATRQDVWLQIVAMELLPEFSPETLLKALRIRLTRHHGGDDLFFRHRAVLALAPLSGELEGAEELVIRAREDPSEHVRMALAKSYHHFNLETQQKLLKEWTATETSHRVRATLALNLKHLVDIYEDPTDLADHLNQQLRGEFHPFTLRVLMKVIGDLGEILGRRGLGKQWFDKVGPQLHHWITEKGEALQKRWGTRALASCWIWAEPNRASFFETSQALIQQTPLGKKCKLRPPKAPAEDLLVILSMIVQEDHPVEVRPGKKTWTLCRGQRFGFRFWRTLHELRNPSPDKRQGHSHTIGRWYRESYQLPSAFLGEMSETKVPGEPLVIPEEGNWRPHLPLPDLALGALNGPWLRREVRVVTPEGITVLTVPLNPFRRLWCGLKLSFTLPSLAPLRNWRPGTNNPPWAYAEKLSRCGVILRFIPSDFGFGPLKDPTIQAMVEAPDTPLEFEDQP